MTTYEEPIVLYDFRGEVIAAGSIVVWTSRSGQGYVSSGVVQEVAWKRRWGMNSQPWFPRVLVKPYRQSGKRAPRRMVWIERVDLLTVIGRV